MFKLNKWTALENISRQFFSKGDLPFPEKHMITWLLIWRVSSHYTQQSILCRSYRAHKQHMPDGGLSSHSIYQQPR